jgi:hypothetical protein
MSRRRVGDGGIALLTLNLGILWGESSIHAPSPGYLSQEINPMRDLRENLYRRFLLKLVYRFHSLSVAQN